MQSDSQPFNPEVLLELVGGDYGQLQEILDLFLSSFIDTPASLETALQQQDFQQASRLVHQLKGSIANIWEAELYERSARLEAILDTNSPPDEALLQLWLECYKTSMQAIRTYISEHCSQA